ncbi:MAG: DUF4838 domain-containing protein [Opitutaceae bacterium]
MPLVRLIVCLLFVAMPFLVLAQTPRAASWLPKQNLGSSRLALTEIERIALPERSGDRLQAAVADLQFIYSERVGRKLEIVEHTSPAVKSAIVLKLNEPLDSTGSFLIYRQRTQVIIKSNSVEGLANAIYELCGGLLGARWYWASDLGLEYIGDVPGKFPEQRWLETPSFVQRALYPMSTDFGRRNRLNRPFQFNHALARVFNPEVYEVESYVFSRIKGSRREPEGHAGRDPQPHLAHSRAVEIAAKAAIEYFEKNPNSLSFSLSINDNVMFDESEQTRQQVSPLKYFRTRPDYTDYVFGFMNSVAEKVFDKAGLWQTDQGEDRYLTALAYYWTEPSPTIEIHPRVMPVLTSDRAQWHDEAYRAEDKALITRWANSGTERVATWDYYFGSPYPYPRQFNQWIDESLKYLSGAGVDVLFSQLPSAWGLDGPKAWLASELLWDVHQDADALLEEYYLNFFGAAAEPMRGFYETAEAYRNEHAGKADWIKYYKDEAGVGMLSPKVLREMRVFIEEARATVLADERRLARVEIVSEAFAFTEAYARFHAAREALIEACFVRSPKLLECLSEYQKVRSEYFKFANRLVSLPMHKRLKYFTKQLQTDPTSLALAVLAQEGRLPADYDDYGLLEWVDQQASYQPNFANVELPHEGQYQFNFLGPVLPIVHSWSFDFRPSQHLAVVGARGEEQGIRVSGADVFSIFRDEPVNSERGYLLDTTMAWSVSPDNRSQVKLIWRDESGKRLRTDLPIQLPWGASNGDQQLLIPFKSPESAVTVRIHYTVSRQYEGDFLELLRVDFFELPEQSN